jgi:hypothetical protein
MGAYIEHSLKGKGCSMPNFLDMIAGCKNNSSSNCITLKKKKILTVLLIKNNLNE